jgi:hypothetical protein
MLCYVVLCYVMLCYVVLCYVMLCRVMLCYVMLCCVMLSYVCYVTLCYVIDECSAVKHFNTHYIHYWAGAASYCKKGIHKIVQLTHTHNPHFKAVTMTMVRL